MPTPDYPPPKDHNDWPDVVVRAYYCALGAFLQHFGDAEAGFLFLIDRYASGLIAHDVNRNTPPSEHWARTRVQTDVVRALVGSKRSADIADTIKLLLRIAKRPDTERVIASEALDQLGQIRVIRDRIVHTGARPLYEGRWVFKTGNSHEVREREKAKDYIFRIEDLEAMALDLRAIRLRIGVATLYDEPTFRDFARTHGAFEPWRYKPIQPIARDHKPRKIRGSDHPRPLPPFEAVWATATSYPVTEGGPLAYVGKPRPKKE